MRHVFQTSLIGEIFRASAATLISIDFDSSARCSPGWIAVSAMTRSEEKIVCSCRGRKGYELWVALGVVPGLGRESAI
jgi:hypothetical protein